MRKIPIVRISDKEIYQLLQKNDTKAMELLFKKYYKPLVLWSDTIIGNVSAAEDLVQDFFVKLWNNKLYRKLEYKTLSSYLYVSVRNLSYNSIKKQNIISSDLDISDVEEIVEEYSNDEDVIVDKVMTEIDKLPPRSKEIVKCVLVKNMKYKETAEELGVSVATVKTLLVNSLKKLRLSLGEKSDILLFIFFKKNH